MPQQEKGDQVLRRQAVLALQRLEAGLPVSQVIGLGLGDAVRVTDGRPYLGG